MSGKVIWKYQMRANPLPLPWPGNSKVVHIAEQFAGDGFPTLWVEHDLDHLPEPDSRSVEFFYTGTGHHNDRVGYHIGTAVCAEGQLVWHVYRAIE